MKQILVTAKVNPDLDGTSCTLAYSDLLNQLGKPAEGIIFGSPQSEVKYFIDKHGVQIQTKDDMPFSGWQEFVLVDASSMKGMPKVVIPEKVIEVIDHRKGEPEKEFPNAKIQNELIGAAATIVVERFIDANKKPSLEQAKLLYGAIYHNTLNFIATNSGARDHKAAKWLENNFGITDRLVREMFDYATKEIENDPKTALENDAKEFGGGYAIGAYQLIVWGPGIFDKKEEIEQGVQELNKKLKADWSFLNIVDLESNGSTLYVPTANGQEIVSEAVGAKFKDSWATLSDVLLRKQIMPKVQEVVDKHAS